jgi:hypothetical protein
MFARLEKPVDMREVRAKVKSKLRIFGAIAILHVRNMGI